MLYFEYLHVFIIAVLLFSSDYSIIVNVNHIFMLLESLVILGQVLEIAL